MDIYWLRWFAFGDKFYTDTSVHKHFHTISFATQPNIDAHIWLTIFSSGGKWENGGITDLGIAAAGIKSVKYINSNGSPQVDEFDTWRGHLRKEKVVEITFAFHVKLAWAKAEGTIFYWE